MWQLRALKLVKFQVRLVTLLTSSICGRVCLWQVGIRPQEISTQVLPRDLHAEYFSALAFATSIERMATEIRGLQKSEQREVEEYFAKGKRQLCYAP